MKIGRLLREITFPYIFLQQKPLLFQQKLADSYGRAIFQLLFHTFFTFSLKSIAFSTKIGRLVRDINFLHAFSYIFTFAAKAIAFSMKIGRLLRDITFPYIFFQQKPLLFQRKLACFFNGNWPTFTGYHFSIHFSHFH